MKIRAGGPALRSFAQSSIETCLRSFDERRPQIVVNGLLRNPERATNAYRRQITAVHHSVHRHLGNAHNRCDFGDCQESDVDEGRVSGA